MEGKDLHEAFGDYFCCFPQCLNKIRDKIDAVKLFWCHFYQLNLTDLVHEASKLIFHFFVLLALVGRVFFLLLTAVVHGRADVVVLARQVNVSQTFFFELGQEQRGGIFASEAREMQFLAVPATAKLNLKTKVDGTRSGLTGC